MIFKCFFALFLSLALTASGYCFDIDYPLTGHEFMPVKKGDLYMELSSKTTNKENKTLVDSSRIDVLEQKTSTIAVYGAYDLTDKVSINIELPYVNVERKIGSNSTKDDDIGDISIGAKYQITNQNISFINSFLNFTAILPTGKSPYKVDPWKELSTGSGGYSLKPEMAFTKKIKSALFFYSIFYQYNLPINGLNYHQSATDGESGVFLKDVKRGDEFGASIGFVEFLHKNISCMIRYNLHRKMKTSYDWMGRDDYKSDSGDTSTISTGFGFAGLFYRQRYFQQHQPPPL